MKSKISIFIAISPSHISNFQVLIKNIFKEEGCYILLNPGNFDFKKEYWHTVINGNLDLRYRPTSFYNKILYQILKIKGYKSLYKKTTKLFDHIPEADLYFCHMEDIMTNHLVNKLRKYKENNFYVIEDGILNYYQPKTNLKSLWLKKVLCLLFGLDFRIFNGHASQIQEDWVSYQYVRMPDKSICPKKSKLLPFELIDYNPVLTNVLILGQDIREEIDGNYHYISKLRELFKIVAKMEPKGNIYYKPHRNGSIETAKILLDEFFVDYQIYDNPTPVEECLIELLPKAIYSFESTAILNIKLALNREDINLCIYPYMNNFPEVGKLYYNLGVTVF